MACNRLRLGSCCRSPRSSCQGTTPIWYADDASMATMRQVGALGERQTVSRVIGALSRGVGPRAGALVGHRHKVVQPRTSDAIQEALTFHTAKRKSLPPD